MLQGMPAHARVVLDGENEGALAALSTQSLVREAAWLDSMGRVRPGPADYLALSGGSADGAFGAGVLTVWIKLGTRPEFRVVTGVSTGFDRSICVSGLGVR